MATVALASALLALAALLAGLGVSVRALSGVDGKARPVLLSAGVGVGVLAAGIGLTPELFGQQTLTVDASTVTIMAGAVVVAAADVVEAILGARLVLLARPAKPALREGDAAMAAGDAAGAAAAYARAVRPLARGKRRQAELDARLRLTEALVGSGDLNGAAIKLHEALVSAREQGDPEVTWATLLRAVLIDCDLDRLPMANRHLGEAATIARDRLSQSHLANVFAELAWVAYLAGDRELAGTCIGWGRPRRGQDRRQQRVRRQHDAARGTPGPGCGEPGRGRVGTDGGRRDGARDRRPGSRRGAPARPGVPRLPAGLEGFGP